MNYTKGQWFWHNPFEDNIAEHQHWNLRCKSPDGVDKHILYTTNDVRTNDDALLIAATPELYEALKELKEAYEHLQKIKPLLYNLLDANEEKVYHQIEKALIATEKSLAKAEGK